LGARKWLGALMNRPLENVRVLLVEDDPIIALDLRNTLELAGATVVGTAHDVASAATLLQNTPFDVAVLDHLIVGGDSVPVGNELFRRGLRFLFHTSHRGQLREQFPHAPVIDKPSRPGELVAAVRSLVDI
jgi:DNA-binding response OmpR family regulator